MLDTYLEDTFGKRYVLKRSSDLSSQSSFKALSFSDESHAFQFLSHLRTPLDYWHKTVSKNATVSSRNFGSAKLCSQHLAAQLLFRKQLFLFELEASSRNNEGAAKRSIAKSNGDTFIFSHVSSLLVSQPREVIQVSSKADAEKLLAELSPNDDQLKQLSKELDISALESSGSSATKEKLIAALVAGEVIINVRKPLASPPTRETEAGVSAADKPAELSPDAGTVTVKQAAPADPMSNINQKPQADTLVKASDEGTPFCEECEKAKEENKSNAA